mgnify:FL=1
MDSKVILNKNFYKTIFFFTLVFFFVIAKKINAAENLHYLSSYYGSLLAGQIAKYNNENEIASKYYRFANKKNPKNNNILELSLMSSLLSGDIKLALEDLEKNDNNLSIENSKVSQLLKFIKYIKNENYKKALNLLNQNEEIIITSKVQPIIKAWLADSFSNAKSEIDQFEYKSDGLVMSDIYFIHLALINNFYKDKQNAINILEKTLNSGIDNRLRHMFFYRNLIEDNIEENKIIKSFVNKNPSHSFNIYVNKENLIDFKISSKKDGISESLFNIAEALYSQRMYDLSIAYCYLSLYLNKNNFINYYLLSQNFIMLQKAENAISVLENIPLNSYLGWNSFLKIADINLNLNNYSKAENFILQLKKYSSNRVDVHYKLGEIYHNKKDYDKAVKAFNEAISLLKISSEENWYLYYSRGMSYERSNQWEKAEKDFLYALELSPQQPLVLNYLGYTWIDYGMNLKKAENFIREAIKLRPKDGYFIDSLGWAYYRQGKYDLAVLELEKAVGLIPNDPVINDHLGDALFRAGYYNEARYQWNRALLYEPEKELKENIKFKLEKGL